MSGEVDRIFEALSHGVRRGIIRLLGERGELTYTALMNALGVETGVLNYHLSKLEGFVEKTERGYRLTDLGMDAYRVLVFAERGGAEPQGGVRVRADPLRHAAMLLLNPVRAFREASRGGYLVSSALVTAAYLLSLLLVQKSPLLIAAAYGFPLAFTTVAAVLIYAVSELDAVLTVKLYGLTFIPQLVYLAVVLAKAIYAPHAAYPEAEAFSYFCQVFLRPAVTIAYLVYMTLFAKEAFKLSTSQGFVTALVGVAATRHALAALGAASYPCITMPF